MGELIMDKVLLLWQGGVFEEEDGEKVTIID